MMWVVRLLSLLSTSLTDETHSKLCQVEGHRVVVDDWEGPSGRADGAAHDAPAEAEDGRVYSLAEQRHLLGVQVDQNIVDIQRRPHYHLHKHRTEKCSIASNSDARSCEAFDTDPDILGLSSIHQLTFQDLQTLHSQCHHALKHLNTPKQL